MESKCPKCGYCEHCGRSNLTPYPYIQPLYPYVQKPLPQPYWTWPGYPTVTCGTQTNYC